jgi:hypothetical protein
MVNLGQGTWTFYGGHDPEDYQHMVGDPPTDSKFASKFGGVSLDSEQCTLSIGQRRKREKPSRLVH